MIDVEIYNNSVFFVFFIFSFIILLFDLLLFFFLVHFESVKLKINSYPIFENISRGLYITSNFEAK